MKTNLIRLMAIATLATSMSFAGENSAKRTESAQPAADANTMQQEKAAKKARKAERQKKQKEDTAQQSNDATLSIWG